MTMQPEKEFDSKIKEFKRYLVRDLLIQCTLKQIALFNRMYQSIELIKEKDMRCAYGQCARTLEKTRGE